MHIRISNSISNRGKDILLQIMDSCINYVSQVAGRSAQNICCHCALPLPTHENIKTLFSLGQLPTGSAGERWLMSRIRFALFLSLLRCSLSTHLLHSTEFIPKVRDFFYDVEGIAEKQSRAVSPILIKFAGEMC